MNTFYFDIETGPLPDSQIMYLFDPSEVALGNRKDPEKIREKIEEEKLKFVDRAALDPLTGRVLAIGWLDGDQNLFKTLCDDNEKELLLNWWDLIAPERYEVRHCIGFNCHLFDWPFLVRRSWHHGIMPPKLVRKGRYWSEEFVDLRDIWQMGDKYAKGSLNDIAKHFGLEPKQHSGEQFYQLWKSDRDQALDYLRHDVELTWTIANRMGVA
jgi:DNA polymerase elongation subunit (family B)